MSKGNKKKDIKPHNPHDHFFRQAMSEPKVARAFFQKLLPANLQKAMTWKSIQLQPKSFITDLGKELIADLVFKTKFGKDSGYLVLLVEHQSKQDELMPLRILKYTCQIIDKHLSKQKGGKPKIPLVFPMVVYHGKTPYKHTTNINDLVAAPRKLVDQYFLKPFKLLDLTQIPDEKLRKDAWFGILAFVQKHIYDRDFAPHLDELTKLVIEIYEAGATKFSAIVVQYLIESGRSLDKQAFAEKLSEKLPKALGNKIMTIAEGFRKEGRMEGQREGREQIARKLLRKTKDRDLVKEVTGFSDAHLNKIEKRIKN